MAIDWRIMGTEICNCNCAYGCPCQFNAMPTHGNCRGLLGFDIEEGHFGTVRLDGLRAVLLLSYPGPIHAGNGTIQPNIGERAVGGQPDALLTIIIGQAPAAMR